MMFIQTGYVLFVCHTVLGWSKEEVSVFVAHWRRQVRSKKTHAFYRQRVVWGRSDGKFEQGSMFSPYWQARLVDTPQQDKLLLVAAP